MVILIIFVMLHRYHSTKGLWSSVLPRGCFVLSIANSSSVSQINMFINHWHRKIYLEWNLHSRCCLLSKWLNECPFLRRLMCYFTSCNNICWNVRIGILTKNRLREGRWIAWIHCPYFDCFMEDIWLQKIPDFWV